jgi:hypothetical protein
MNRRSIPLRTAPVEKGVWPHIYVSRFTLSSLRASRSYGFFTKNLQKRDDSVATGPSPNATMRGGQVSISS